MRSGQAYVEIGSRQEEERHRARQLTHLTRQAAKFGLTLTAAA